MVEFLARQMRHLTVILGLVCVISLLLLWPARHVLVPLWPAQMEESLYQNDSNSIQRIFHRAGAEPAFPGKLIARNRPLTLLSVEREEQNPVVGYLSGVRPESEALVSPELPTWLEPDLIEVSSEPSKILVLVVADGEIVEIPLAGVRRLFRPNRLRLRDRLMLAWRRLEEAIGSL